MILMAMPVKAQHVSSEYDFSCQRGTKTIVRAVANDYSLTYNDTTDGSKNHFTYRKQTGTTGYQAKLIPPLSINGAIRYKINDMCVIGKMCYFCGQILTPMEPTMPPVGPNFPVRDDAEYTSKGFIGRFNINACNIPTFPSTYATVNINNTYSLNRMDYYVEGSDTTLAFVGQLDSDTTRTCVVSCSVSNPAGTSPSYMVKYSEDTNEFFTDVVVTEKQIALVSRNNADNHTFYIRYDFHNNWSQFSLSDLDIRYAIGISSVPSTDYSWRRNDADIRACCIPGSDFINVAYECNSTGGDGSSMYNSALFKIELFRPLNLIASRCVSGRYRNYNCFKDIAYLTCDNSVALLFSDPTENLAQSRLFLMNWPAISSTMSLRIRNKNVETMDIYNGRYIYMGGKYTGTSSFVQLTQENTTMPGEMDLCHASSHTYFFELQDIVVKTQRQELNEKCRVEFNWSTLEMARTKVLLERICAYDQSESF